MSLHFGLSRDGELGDGLGYVEGLCWSFSLRPVRHDHAEETLWLEETLVHLSKERIGSSGNIRNLY